MLISKTPFRASFFGGGTDFPEYFEKKNSLVIGASIDKYLYLFYNKFYSNLFNHNLRIFYKRNEFVKNIKDIKHKVFRKVLLDEKILKDFEIHVSSELPSFVGLGSSSSFTVGLINLAKNFKGINLSKRQLAIQSVNMERYKLKENVGLQDQILAAYGGFNSIKFFENKFQVNPIEVNFSLKNFFNKIFLVYTGIQRSASVIEKKKFNSGYVNNPHLNTIRDIAFEANNFFKKSKNDNFFGKLIHETWIAKKKINKIVSNKKIDDLYEKALDAGSSGGKLLGAGAGGFVLFFVENNKREKFIKAFKNHAYINIQIDFKGSRIVKLK
jgi:D-glycero-alpha-D-manno-heptose-7-phosphate kinase